MESNTEYDKDWLNVLCSSSSYNQDKTDWSPIYDWIGEKIGEGTILDVGCGFGHLLALFQDRWTIGLDFSQIALNIAKTRCPNTEFYLIDAENSDLISTLQYDIICFTEVLEHVKDDIALIQKVPSGKIVFISVPQETNLHPQHLRTFFNLKDAVDRYKPYLRLLNTQLVGKYNFICIHGIKI
jgi:2-polyprenyl-3-methyl-5-hydroxy-6-metoxy-1,4-benzoquinol methylase